MHNKGLVKYYLIAVIMVLSCLLLALPVTAQEGSVINEDINKTAGDLEIPGGTTVNGDVALNVGNLKVLGIINGNVNNNMGQVTVDGDVNGDVETNMGQVLVNGNVSGNVKTRMGEIIINGSVGGNLESDLGEAGVSGSVGGDVYSGFGELRITGLVAGNVSSNGGKIIIDGIVEGDVTLDQGVIELGPNAVVTGKVYVRRGMIEKADHAMIGSVEIGEEMLFEESDRIETGSGYHFEGLDDSEHIIETVSSRIVEEVRRGLDDLPFIPGFNWDWSLKHNPFMNFYGNTARGIINMLIMFALAALTHTLFPKNVKAAGAAVTTKPGPVAGWGLLALILAVPLMFVLVLTIIGIPLVVVEVILLAAAGILGYTGITYLLGGKIIDAASSKPANPLGSIALGVLILGFVGMVPIIGGLVTVVIYIFAIGTALVTRFGTKHPEDEAVTFVEQPEETEKQ
jgi:cytoskeletal protein CcmA (bactofilin family)